MFKRLTTLLLIVGACASVASAAGGGAALEPAYDGYSQIAEFPLPSSKYHDPEGGSLGEVISSRAAEQPFNVWATIIFVLAICHTFASSFFLKIGHDIEHKHEEELKAAGKWNAEDPKKNPVSFMGKFLHFFGEVEAIFGIWVIALAIAASQFFGFDQFKNYISHDRVFTEPMFVVVIMAIAASRPVLRFSEQIMAFFASFGKGTPTAWWLSVLTVAPILGSFITEPAAMTIGASLLAKKFYKYNPKPMLAYATLGILFVNVSVGGTLTHFAAPPGLMVASIWHWGMGDMIVNLGAKAVLGIDIANIAYLFFFKKDIAALGKAMGEDAGGDAASWEEREDAVPAFVTVAHLFFLAWTVFFAHDPAFFIGGFLVFIAFTIMTKHHQNSISMQGPLLVGFFLAGLIIHGGCQGWWIEPVIVELQKTPWILMLGSTLLTAINDNAAITYLASQVAGITTDAKYFVVAGAVTGGGLTVIANAPNPAGQSILGKYFQGGIKPLGLLLGALVPTIIVYLCFAFIPHTFKDEVHGDDHGHVEHVEHGHDAHDSHDDHAEKSKSLH